jgi:hypothetical protein
MSLKIRVEIDDSQLDATIVKLQNAGAGSPANMATIGAAGKPSSGGTKTSVSAGRQQYAGGALSAQPGGVLPSIPRGIRTTIGVMPGGYEAVATYQKALWFEQGIQSVLLNGLTVAGITELYTFAILMAIDIKKVFDDMERNQLENYNNIREMSDINSSVAFKEWKKVQDNPYRGRRSE